MSKRKEIRGKSYINLVMSQPNHERSVQVFFRPQKLSVEESTVKHYTHLSLTLPAQIPLTEELLSHKLQLIWHKPSWKPGYIGHSWSSCFTAAGSTNSSPELRYFSISAQFSSCMSGVQLCKTRHPTVTVLHACSSHAQAAIKSAPNLNSASSFNFFPCRCLTSKLMSSLPLILHWLLLSLHTDYEVPFCRKSQTNTSEMYLYRMDACKRLSRH